MVAIASSPARQVPDPDKPISRQEAEDIHGHLRAVEGDVDNVKATVDQIRSAVFGNALDTEDHGIVGDVRSVLAKLDRVFHSVLGLMGVLVIVAVTIALAIH